MESLGSYSQRPSKRIACFSLFNSCFQPVQYPMDLSEHQLFPVGSDSMCTHNIVSELNKRYSASHRLIGRGYSNVC